MSYYSAQYHKQLIMNTLWLDISATPSTLNAVCGFNYGCKYEGQSSHSQGYLGWGFWWNMSQYVLILTNITG